MKDDKWYFERDGQSIGPISLGELKNRVSSGDLTHLSLVRSSFMSEWESAGRVANLYGTNVALNTPPPLPVERTGQFLASGPTKKERTSTPVTRHKRRWFTYLAISTVPAAIALVLFVRFFFTPNLISAVNSNDSVQLLSQLSELQMHLRHLEDLKSQVLNLGPVQKATLDVDGEHFIRNLRNHEFNLPYQNPLQVDPEFLEQIPAAIRGIESAIRAKTTVEAFEGLKGGYPKLKKENDELRNLQATCKSLQTHKASLTDAIARWDSELQSCESEYQSRVRELKKALEPGGRLSGVTLKKKYLEDNLERFGSRKESQIKRIKSMLEGTTSSLATTVAEVEGVLVELKSQQNIVDTVSQEVELDFLEKQNDALEKLHRIGLSGDGLAHRQEALELWRAIFNSLTQMRQEIEAQRPSYPRGIKENELFYVSGFTHKIDGEQYWLENKVVTVPREYKSLYVKGQGRRNRVFFEGIFRFVGNASGRNAFGAEVNIELYECDELHSEYLKRSNDYEKKNSANLKKFRPLNSAKPEDGIEPIIEVLTNILGDAVVSAAIEKGNSDFELAIQSRQPFQPVEFAETEKQPEIKPETLAKSDETDPLPSKLQNVNPQVKSKDATGTHPEGRQTVDNEPIERESSGKAFTPSEKTLPKSTERSDVSPSEAGVDLLSYVDSRCIDSRFQIVSGKLHTPRYGGNTAVLAFKGLAVPAEYNIEMTVERRGDDRYGCNMGIVMGGKQAVVDMDGSSDPKWCLSRIDGHSIHDSANPTIRKGRRLAIGKVNEVRIEVRRQGVAVFQSDKEVFRWNGLPSQLSLWDKIELPTADCLFFFSQAEFVVHRLRMVPIGSKTTDAKSNPGDAKTPSKKVIKNSDPNLADRERLAAKTILELGGTVHLHGRPAPLRAVADIPNEQFVIRRIQIDKQKWKASKRGRISNNDMKMLENLKGLEIVHLPGTGITDEGVRSLCTNRRLKLLWVFDNQITNKSLSHIAKLSDLENLNINNTKITELAPLSSLKNLTKLYLAAVKIDDSDLPVLLKFPKLRLLHLHATPITDKSISTLTQLRNLTELGIPGTRISPRGKASLSKQLSGCKVLK
jgi:hypothetical protein